MKSNHHKLDAHDYQPASARLSRSTWLAIQQCRRQFSQRDNFPYSFGAVMVFLLETYLYEQQRIPAPPVLRTHQLTLKELEDQIDAVSKQLAAILNPKSKENL